MQITKDRTKIIIVGIAFFTILIAIYYLFGFKFLFHVDTLLMSYIKLSMFKEGITKNIIPFWNPYEGAGVPLMFMGSMDINSIFLLKWLSIRDYMVILGFLYICLIISFQYLFLKGIRCSDGAAILGSFIWGVNAFFLIYAHEFVYSLIGMFIPIGLLSIKNIMDRKNNIFWIIVFICITAVQFTTGRWALIQYLSLVYSIWIIINCYDHRKGSYLAQIKRVIRGNIFLVTAFGLSFLLSAFFTLPYLETISSTYRSLVPNPPKQGDWLVLLVGHFFPYLGMDAGHQYIPLIIIPFAIIGFVSRTRLQIFCIILSLLYLLFAFDFHLFQFIQKLPFQSGNVNTVRLVLFLYLSLSIMSALGFDRCFMSSSEQERVKYLQIFKKTVIIFILMFIAVFIASLTLRKMSFFNALFFNGEGNIYDNIRQNNYIKLFKIILVAFFITYIVSLGFIGKIVKRHKWFLIILTSILFYFVAIIIIRLTRTAMPLPNIVHFLSIMAFIWIMYILYKGIDFFSNRCIYASGLICLYCIVFCIMFNKIANPLDYEGKFKEELHAGIVKKLKMLSSEEEAPYRILASKDVFKRQTHFGLVGLETFNYYLPLPPYNLYRYFRDLTGNMALTTSLVDKVFSTFFSLANVKYIILSRQGLDENLHKLKNPHEINGYKLLYEDNEYLLFKDENCFDRFRMVYDYKVIDDDDRMIAFMKSKEADTEFWGKVVVLDQDVDIADKGTLMNDAVVNLIEHNQNKYLLTTRSDSDGILVISNRFDKNWHAKIDSNEEKILKANYLFMAVRVPAGEHLIELSYNNKRFSMGCWISLSTLVALVCLMTFRKGLNISI